ncbi:PTS sugar transporter subunit IIA [Anaerococcus senegalensis]|uniref:PTS sugar transporter subunit IIA n=1 Tax=Anaerococcus senegalensis TaxID=1288120 RepID=UPI00031FE00D|nr:PTS sugar transporter subunit IIA [Anaerococcus senegalensis]
MEITDKNTKFDIEVKDWKEAILETGRLLEISGYANEDYKYNIIKDVKNYGSYIMISPNVVIPHTRPENGALKIGCSIITIKNDIYFDDNKQDSIKVLIGFTAIDNKNHLDMLKKIINIIEKGLVDKLNYFLNLSKKDKLTYLNSLIREDE